MKRFWSALLSAVFAVSVIAPYAQAATKLWDIELEDKMLWNEITQYGTLLVGAKASLASYNPETGEKMWYRDDLGRLAPFDVKEIKGFPVLMITEDLGLGGTKSIVQAINISNGQTIWKTDTLAGMPLGIYPVANQPVALFMINEIMNTEKAGVYVHAYNIETGALLWKTFLTEIDRDTPLHMAENTGIFSPRMDLSGYHDPLYENGIAYVPVGGLHAIELSTGKMVWSVPFVSAHKVYKKAFPVPVIDGDTIYSGGPGGTVYALDKATGAIKWQSEKVRSGIITQIVAAPEMLILRIGGNFYNPGSKAVELDKPLLVSALNKADGKQLWEYEGAKGGITNFVYMPQYNSVFFADAKSLVSIDTRSTGEVKEAFRLPLEFKRSIGTTDMVSGGVKALTGGLGGALRAGVKMARGKDREDPPIAVIPQPNGTVVVRGQQHILSFDPSNQSTAWSATFHSPGASMLGAALVVAVSVVAVAGYQMQYATGQTSMSSASSNIQSQFDRMDKYLDKRYSKTQSDQRYAYILTNVEDGADSGIGIAAINLTTGETDNQVVLGDKDPEYTVDEIGQVVYYFNKKKVIAYNLE